jgi:hypothetical protein
VPESANKINLASRQEIRGYHYDGNDPNQDVRQAFKSKAPRPVFSHPTKYLIALFTIDRERDS